MKLLDGPSKLTRKADRAQFITKTLLDPKQIPLIYAKMDELSQHVLAAAYYNDGIFNANAFVARHGELPTRQRKDEWDWYGQPILIELFVYDGRLHAELMPLLADLVTPPEPFQLQGYAQLPADLAAEEDLSDLRLVKNEEIGWHDLLLFLQLLDQNSIRFSTSSARLTPASLQTLFDNLLQGDFFAPLTEDKGKFDESIRPFGLTQFAIGAGLVNPVQTGRLTEQGAAYLRSQAPHLLLEAFETWTETGAYDELHRIDAIRGMRSRGIKLTEPGTRRARIIEALSWCPTDVWIAIADFYQALKIWQFDFDLEVGGPNKLYAAYRYEETSYYEPIDGSKDRWLYTNGLYINVILWEYLGSIGALDLAYVSAEEADLDLDDDNYFGYFDDLCLSRYDGLFYFRINPLGAFLFGQATDYESRRPLHESVFVATPKGELRLLNSATVTPVVSVRLQQIATTDDEQIYQLDAEKILQAFEEGAEPQELHEFLARHNQGPLPDAIPAWLEQRYKDSRAYAIKSKALLIQASRELIQKALEDEQLGKMSQKVDERTLVIAASQESRFRSRLRKLGYGIR